MVTLILNFKYYKANCTRQVVLTVKLTYETAPDVLSDVTQNICSLDLLCSFDIQYYHRFARSDSNISFQSMALSQMSWKSIFMMTTEVNKPSGL